MLTTTGLLHLEPSYNLLFFYIIFIKFLNYLWLFFTCVFTHLTTIILNFPITFLITLLFRSIVKFFFNPPLNIILTAIIIMVVVVIVADNTINFGIGIEGSEIGEDIKVEFGVVEFMLVNSRKFFLVLRVVFKLVIGSIAGNITDIVAVNNIIHLFKV